VKKILIVGASGYLGRYLVSEAKKQGYWVRALLRRKSGKNLFQNKPDQIFIGEATNPESLRELCRDIDIVISSLGITRQKDGLSYMDVDFQANKNILDKAIEANVGHFAYVSVLNGQNFRISKLIDAKERFVDYLKSKEISSSIIRPTGFFSDMRDFQSMAKNGKAYLFGDGSMKINPIDGEDLAVEIIKSLKRDIKELEIGGPVTYTLNQIVQLAFDSLKVQGKIVYIPDFVRKLVLKVLPLVTPLSVYGPVQFFLTSMSEDGNTEEYGSKKLDDFFADCL